MSDHQKQHGESMLVDIDARSSTPHRLSGSVRVEGGLASPLLAPLFKSPSVPIISGSGKKSDRGDKNGKEGESVSSSPNPTKKRVGMVRQLQRKCETFIGQMNNVTKSTTLKDHGAEFISAIAEMVDKLEENIRKEPKFVDYSSDSTDAEELERENTFLRSKIAALEERVEREGRERDNVQKRLLEYMETEIRYEALYNETRRKLEELSSKVQNIESNMEGSPPKMSSTEDESQQEEITVIERPKRVAKRSQLVRTPASTEIPKKSRNMEFRYVGESDQSFANGNPWIPNPQHINKAPTNVTSAVTSAAPMKRKENNGPRIINRILPGRTLPTDGTCVIIKNEPTQAEQLNGDELYHKIRTTIRPKNIGVEVKTIFVISQARVVIICNTATDVRKLTDEIKRTMKVQVVDVKKRHPLICISRIPRVYGETVNGNVDEEIFEYNPNIQGMNKDSFKFAFAKKTRNGQVNHIYECEPEIYKQIITQGYIKMAYERLRVYPHSRFVQCYKCQRFGHTTKKCNTKEDEQICGHCSLKHPTNQCNKKETAAKCINCIRYNENVLNKRLMIDPSHPAYAWRCPVLDRIWNNTKEMSENGY